MEIDVLGTGESLSEYEPSDNYVIGVNTVSAKIQVNVLVVVDHPDVFRRKGTYAQVRNGYYKAFATQLTGLWNAKVALVFNKIKGDVQMIRGYDRANTYFLPHSNNSTFVAACLAWKLGATRINLYGVDFNTHPHLGLDPHRKKTALNHFRRLHEFLQNNNCQLFTTPQSSLSEFLPVIPRLLACKS